MKYIFTFLDSMVPLKLSWVGPYSFCWLQMAFPMDSAPIGGIGNLLPVPLIFARHILFRAKKPIIGGFLGWCLSIP